MSSRSARAALAALALAGICGAALAQVAEKRAELKKVQNYIKVLDQKIIKARQARKINKIAQLKDLKRKQLARAKSLRADIARLEKSGPRPRARARAIRHRRRGFLLNAGYAGGAGMIGAGYSIPIAAVDLVINPARAVNPDVEVVIKYPNWYEHFQGLGFDLETQPALFDGLYTGNETRSRSSDQHLQQYHGYSIFLHDKTSCIT